MMKTITVIALLMVTVAMAAADNGRIQQVSYAYEVESGIIVDPSQIHLEITGNRHNGNIYIHLNDPYSVVVGSSHGTTAFDFTMNVRCVNGLLKEYSYENIYGPSSHGNISDVMAYGNWNGDYFHLIISYILNIKFPTISIPLNARVVLYGKIGEDGVFIGRMNGIYIPYYNTKLQPEEVIVTNGAVNSSDYFSVINGHRALSPYRTSIGSQINLPAPNFVSGRVYNLEDDDGILTAKMDIATLTGFVNVTDGDFVGGYERIQNKMYRISLGVITSGSSMYLLDGAVVDTR